MKNIKIIKLLLSLCLIMILIFSTIINTFALDLELPSEESIPSTIDSKDDIASTSDYVSFVPRIANVSSSNGIIHISWNEKATGTNQYRVFYKTETSWKTIGYTPNNYFNYMYGAGGETYIFTIRLCDKNNNYISDYDHNGYKFTYILDTPEINDVKTDGDNIIISWDKIEKATKYRVFYYLDNGWKTIGNTTSLSYKFTGGEYKKKYLFTVRCVDSSGKYVSDYNKNGYSYTHIIDMPNISNVYPFDGGIVIKWNSIPNAYKYRVFIKTETSWKTIGTTMINNLLWKDCEYKKNYRFTVRCVDSKGNFTSDYDSNGYIYTYSVDTPKIISVKQYDSTATFSWNHIEGASKYYFFVKTTTSWKIIGQTTLNSFTVKDLIFNDKQVYTVRCANANGSYISDYDKNGFQFGLNYDTPKITNIIPESSTKVKITWGAISGVVRYRLFYKTSDSWKTIATVGTNTYSYSMTLGESKIFTVRCVDANGKFISNYDSKGYAYTFNLDTPKINSVKSYNVVGAAIQITWDKVDGAQYYRVFYKTSTSWKTIEQVSTNSFIWYFVKPNTSFTYTVRCCDANGNYISDFDRSGYTFTLSTSYLQTPKISNISTTSDESAVTIKWDAISGATYYRLFYNTGSGWTMFANNISGTSYTWDGVVPNEEYRYTVRCIKSDGSFNSYYDPIGYTYTLVSYKDSVVLSLGESYCYDNSTTSMKSNWKSSNTSVVSVNKLGMITGIKKGSAKISNGTTSYSVVVTDPEPIRVAYSKPNCAEINENVSLVAITDTTKTAVTFYVNGSYVNATSKESDSYNGYTVYVWKAIYKPTKNGKQSVIAYSKVGDSSWKTCDNAKAEVFVMKDKDLCVCEERRASDAGINFIATCEGCIHEIVDDTLAPGNPTVGYGRVIYSDTYFYNNLSNSQAYGYLVQTVNEGAYTSKTNSTLIKNNSKFKQQHFDALVSLTYNCGTGVLSSYSDVVTLVSLSDLSKATKNQVMNAFCDIHHAGGCVWGLLTRRVDELEMFIIGDYTRDYGYKNRCDIHYTCSRGMTFP